MIPLLPDQRGIVSALDHLQDVGRRYIQCILLSGPKNCRALRRNKYRHQVPLNFQRSNKNRHFLGTLRREKFSASGSKQNLPVPLRTAFNFLGLKIFAKMKAGWRQRKLGDNATITLEWCSLKTKVSNGINSIRLAYSSKKTQPQLNPWTVSKPMNCEYFLPFLSPGLLSDGDK